MGPSASPPSTAHTLPTRIRISRTAWRWWREWAAYEGGWRATRRLGELLWEFLRDSTPERLRSRFGDADYDWDFRVNTTSGAVGWRDRLLGKFHSEYQPTDSAAFHQMLDALSAQAGIDFHDFTFIDLGSGKGRTLLMASDYPFQSIVGVELLPSLHQIAEENLRHYKSDAQKCFALQSIRSDATDFPFPEVALVLFLFNPFPESGMRRVVANLERALREHPRPAYVIYHNALLEHVLAESPALRKVSRAEQYSIFAAV